jgi:SsrA-binding protein
VKLLFVNKKFNINYQSVETYECGIELKGVEVKSIVKANANLEEAFALVKHDEIYLYNMYVAP